MDEVLSFIKQFSDANEDFLFTKSYWFAVILKIRFKGEIFYNPGDNHWLTKIGDKMYDAIGWEDDPVGYSPWPGDFVKEVGTYNSIVRQNIKFTE